MGFLSLGEDAWDAAAQEALANYDALIKRLATIQDDQLRSELMAWVGDGTVLGTPSDGYRYVNDDVKEGTPWDASQVQHVKDLQSINAEFQTRVINAEKSGTYGSSGPLSVIGPDGKLTGIGVGLVVVAALTLFVIPVSLR
jgi:hypothetical protein